MIRRILVFFLISLASVIAPTESLAETFNATAVVLTPITITKTQDLVFGGFTAGASGGTVTKDADNTAARSQTGADVILVNSGSAATPQAAAFTLSGTNGYKFDITLANGTVDKGGDSMSISFLFSDDGSTTNDTRQDRNLNTALTLYVGGTLNVGSDQPTGVYTKSFNITVAYD